MLKLIPAVAGAAVAVGTTALAWYHSLKPSERLRADAVALDAAKQVLDKVVEQAGRVDAMKALEITRKIFPN